MSINGTAERQIFQLETSYKKRVLALLTADDIEAETMGVYFHALDNAQLVSDADVESLRGSTAGDAVADTVIKIQRLHMLTQPVAAGGWRKAARIALLAVLGVGGILAVPEGGSPIVHLFSGAVSVAVGIAAGTVINWFWLGGRPEKRHALAALTNSTAKRRWAAVGAKVGPSPAS